MSSATYRSAAEIGRTEVGARPVPSLGRPRSAVDLAHADVTLPNGLRAVVVRKANVPLVELRLRIPFGGDDRLHTATAEVLAETVLTGTARRDRIGIDTELALVGGELEASVDPELLAFSGSSLASGLPSLLDVLVDSLTAATYAESEVARESVRLVERLSIARTQPETIAREALQRYRYGTHPVASEMPQPEDIAEVTPERVRRLHREAVLPRGATLVLVGDIDLDSAVAQLEKAFEAWISDSPAQVLAPLPHLTGGDLLLVPRLGAVQSQLRLSAQAVSRTDARYAALQLANLAFGGYFSSRLMENIREDKGYTYSAHSGFEFTGGTATVNIKADTASDVTAAALWETRYELGKFGLLPPTDDELESVRQYAIGSLLISTSSQAGLAAQLAALVSNGLGVEWLTAHPARLAAVTGQEVAEVARDFFSPKNFTGVIVGDTEVLGPQFTALGGVTIGQEGAES